MVDSRKPLWPKIVATVVVVAVLYPLSLGPACWVASRNPVRENVIRVAYHPVALLWKRGPAWLSDGFYLYTNLRSDDYLVYVGESHSGETQLAFFHD